MAGLTREYMSQVEMVGYVICTDDSFSSGWQFKGGYVYKVKGVRLDYEDPYFCIEVELDSIGSTTNGWNSNFFKLPDDKLAEKVYEKFGRPMKVDDYCLFDGKVIQGKAVSNVKMFSDIPSPLLKGFPLHSKDTTSIINEYDTFLDYILPENWYTKIKIGDKLKCVVSDNIRDKGAGWENGLVFKVGKIDYFYDSTSGEKHFIFFRDDNKLGVYMAHCKPVESENLLKYIQERDIDDILSNNISVIVNKTEPRDAVDALSYAVNNLSKEYSKHKEEIIEGKSILRVNKKSKKSKVKDRVYDTIVVGKLSFKKKDKFNVKLNKYYE